VTAAGGDPVVPCSFCGIAGVDLMLADMLAGVPPRQQTVWVCADVVPCLERWVSRGKPGPPPLTSDPDTWPPFREHPFE
jgi:hypothetical protein